MNKIAAECCGSCAYYEYQHCNLKTGVGINLPSYKDKCYGYTPRNPIENPLEKHMSSLIRISAQLITSIQLSEYEEDYNFAVPKYMLTKIENQNNELRKISIELKNIYESIRKE